MAKPDAWELWYKKGFSDGIDAVMDNQGFDERDLGDEDESAIKGIRDDLATLNPGTKP